MGEYGWSNVDRNQSSSGGIVSMAEGDVLKNCDGVRGDRFLMADDFITISRPHIYRQRDCN